MIKYKLLDIHTGVPQQPTINGIASTSPGEASLDVSTPEGGVAEGDTLLFVVESQLVDSVDMSISLLEVSNYVDSMVTTLTVNRLTPGMEYRFRVRVQNQFGTSTYSDTAVQQISISESSVSGMKNVHTSGVVNIAISSSC